jgi:hypothetical protein
MTRRRRDGRWRPRARRRSRRLLGDQVELDIDALQAATERHFTEAERDEIRTHQRRAYRWTLLVSGLEHPNFVRIVEQLTTHGAQKVAAAARALAA